MTKQTTQKGKTIVVEEDIWELLIKYRIALRHRSMSETLRYMFKKLKENKK